MRSPARDIQNSHCLVGWLVCFLMRPPTSGGYEDVCMRQYPKEEHIARDGILLPPRLTDMGEVVARERQKNTPLWSTEMANAFP